jgi:hypothetical protein
MIRRDNPWRCTHTTKQRDGAIIECSVPGMWRLDKVNKTWVPAKPTDKSRRCWAHGPGSVAKPAGRGGRRKVQPNARVQRMSGLLDGASRETTLALAEILDELSMLGFPSASSRGVCEVGDEGPVSRDALRIVELTGWREDIRDGIDDLERKVTDFVRLLAQVRGVDYAHGVKLCSENQQGRQGSIEWGDPTCTELPTKHGLCAPCYLRERGWRIRNELPTSEVSAA